jgi:hypothetical protein
MFVKLMTTHVEHRDLRCGNVWKLDERPSRNEKVRGSTAFAKLHFVCNLFHITHHFW